MAQDAADEPRPPRSLAVERFEPTAPADGFLAVQRPTRGAGGDWGLRALATYADAPLVFRAADSPTAEVVSAQMVLHLQAEYRPLAALRLDVDLPVSLLGRGGPFEIDAERRFAAPASAGLHDLRVGAQLAVLDSSGLMPSVDLSLRFWLPTASDQSYAASDELRYAVAAVVGAQVDRFAYAAMFGRRRNAEGAAGLWAAESNLSAAVAWRWADVWIGPELWVSRSNGVVEDFVVERNHAEALLGARQSIGDFSLNVGAAIGLGSAPGTPRFRLLAGLAYAPPRSESRAARESSSVIEAAAGAPGPARESPRSFSPELAAAGAGPEARASTEADADRGGRLGSAGPCPQPPGPAAERTPGCLPDGDGDGTVDTFDACPDVAGQETRPGRVGCPLDADGDGVVDALDACPTRAGVEASDAKRRGCPPEAFVAGDQIDIARDIRFATARADIDEPSLALIDRLARLLMARPEIVRLAVDGHTDDVGRAETNLSLSRRRAVAVLRALVERGVDERRLEVRGFGSRQPRAKNDTPEGRRLNRRVEFVILVTDERGRRAWTDGAIVNAD